MVFCSKCGSAIANDAAFCQTCGTPVARALAVAAPAAVSPHSGAGAIAYILNPVYAGFWLRFFAYLVDRVILGFLTAIVVVPLFFLFGGALYLDRFMRHDFDFRNGGMFGLFTLIAIVSGVALLGQWLYFAYFESGEKQASWGKQALNIYVTDLQGNRISFAAASVRYFAKIISGLIPFGIGYIMAGFTERKQALHDMIASTLVLRR
jgi:uncharacterized RDD family membrane protein YckC